jgi:dienelactone hydrolase
MVTGVLFGALLAVALVALAVLIVPVIADPVPGFSARHGALIATQELSRTSADGSVIVETRLVSSSGLSVDIGVRVPRTGTPRSPTVVLLAGLRTGYRAVELARTPPGIVVAALSYPFPGDPRARGLEWVTWLPRFQRALLDVTPAVMLAVDYLMEQPYVDPRRVELVGGSLGAFFASVPGALDPRVARVWLIHGAGDPRAVFAHLLRPYIRIGPVRELAAQILAWTTAAHHLRPEIWVGRIAPRPVIVVNARADETFPAASVEALHRALTQSGEVIWTEGPHVRPGRTEVVEQLVAMVTERVRRDPPRAPRPD